MTSPTRLPNRSLHHDLVFLLLAVLAFFATGCMAGSRRVQADFNRHALGQVAKAFTPLNDNSAPEEIEAAPELPAQARIGLARITWNGAMAIPEAELKLWRQEAETEGIRVVPISRLLAELYANGITNHDRSPEAQQARLVHSIRSAAVGQRLDAVLLYAMDCRSKARFNAWSAANITIIGAFIAPARRLSSDCYAQALVLEPRRGHVFTASERSRSASRLSPSVGSQSRLEALEGKARFGALGALAAEIRTELAHCQKTTDGHGTELNTSKATEK